MDLKHPMVRVFHSENIFSKIDIFDKILHFAQFASLEIRIFIRVFESWRQQSVMEFGQPHQGATTGWRVGK